MRRVAALLAALYPQAWRERYGEEMQALLEDVTLDARALGSLLTGALGAHLRGRARPLAAAQLRNTAGAAFACFILFALAGAGFAKETEEHSFALAGHHHPLLAVSHAVVLAGSLVAAIAIAIGGLPLLVHAARSAHRTRRRDLGLLLALPPAAIAGFALLTAGLLAIGPSHGPAPAVLALWWLGGSACAACCALAPRAVLARVETPGALLALAVRMAVVLEAAMLAMTGATTLYALALGLQVPGLGAQSGGPLWPTTTLALAGAAAAMALASGLAVRTTLRGVRALRLA